MKLKCINIQPLKGNEIAPPLEIRKEYILLNMFKCTCGQEHYDVGLASKVSYVSCHHCQRHLPDGDSTHWCHPSRFTIEEI